jgi:hypothetical protein
MAQCYLKRKTRHFWRAIHTWDVADGGDASRLKRSEVIASFGEGPIDKRKNPPFLAGFFMGWWRWGELNPRPMQ